jgi:hypothetical protein
LLRNIRIFGYGLAGVKLKSGYLIRQLDGNGSEEFGGTMKIVLASGKEEAGTEPFLAGASEGGGTSNGRFAGACDPV